MTNAYEQFDGIRRSEAATFDTKLSPIPNAIWIGAAGDIDLEFIDDNGDSQTLKGVAAGTMIQGFVVQINSADTVGITAADVILLYNTPLIAPTG